MEVSVEDPVEAQQEIHERSGTSGESRIAKSEAWHGRVRQGWCVASSRATGGVAKA